MRRRKSTAGGNGRAAQTQSAFLEAAKQVFCRHNYDQAGLRDIAAIAGADKRLVTRYFGSKERLFAAALQSSITKFKAARNEYPRLGQRYAERTFGTSDLTDTDRLEFISLCIHSASSPTGKRLVRANVKQQIEEMAGNLGGEDAALRASLLLAMFFGGALVREVLRIEELVGLSVDKAKIYLAPLLQSLVDGKPLRTSRSRASVRRPGPPPLPARSRKPGGQVP